MIYLLDTNFVIRWLNDDNVPKNAAIVVADRSNRIITSVASVYEIQFKIHLGKLSPLDTRPEEIFNDVSSETVPVLFEDANRAAELAWAHRDPWDRIIAAQALRLNATLISSDREFDRLKIPRLWS
jgi:PIN domain nuclease of toxin-antitoxin system